MRMAFGAIVASRYRHDVARRFIRLASRRYHFEKFDDFLR